jgi:dienelactone hydrolase
MMRSVTIWSEGTRLAGDLFIPEDLKSGEKRPTILLCHGWGGPKEHLSATYAPFFCEAGFVCLTFDYRGWFESDARLVVDEKQGEPDDEGFLTVKARAVRDVVDTADQLLDITNCIDFLAGEDAVDMERFGIWGSSMGGGHVVHIAGTDARVKCLVSQVGAPNVALDDVMAAVVNQRATEKARGVHGSLPPQTDGHESLVGKPDYAKMVRFAAIKAAGGITAPSLFIDQEEEELFDRNVQYPEVIKRMDPSVPTEYHTFPGPHYDIYEKNYERGSNLERDWFIKHLMDDQASGS